jgi:hypothetical protein
MIRKFVVVSDQDLLLFVRIRILSSLGKNEGKNLISTQCCGSGSGIRDWVLFDPWIRDPGWEKVSIRIRDPGSGMNNPDHIFLELRNHFYAFFGVKKLKFFDEDPGSGMETVRIRDPGWKKVGSGIRDKHPGSATLFLQLCGF